MKDACTPEHPFYILNADNNTLLVRFEGQDNKNSTGNWVAAKYLKSGMKVLLSNGEYGIINAVEVEHLEETETTYNFEVEDFHTYYVSESGVLVHNTCSGENNVLKNIEYTGKVKAQMAQDVRHGFPSMIDDIAGVQGKVGSITGGDGIVRTAVELPGAINGKLGWYQYIIEPNGITVNHRFFSYTSLLGG